MTVKKIMGIMRILIIGRFSMIMMKMASFCGLLLRRSL